MRKTILIPTDLSVVCANAINHAAKLAENIGARLIVLHVVNPDSLSFIKGNNLEPSYIDNELYLIRKRLEESFDIVVHTIKKEGKLFAVINQMCEQLKANLVVIGTHGKTGIQKITGSHAMKLIRALDIPVLVVQKRDISAGYKKIVFPINVSTEYTVKVDWTIFISKAFNSEVFLFTMKTEDESLKKAMNNIVEKITASFKEHDIKYSLAQAKKNNEFPEQINEFAVSNSADLIMIKVDNDEFEPSFILGAIEEKTIFNSSQIPVFCAQKK